jgi:hypothetical protein
VRDGDQLWGATSSLERQLLENGHVALHGLRFDSNSAVPRAESVPTLAEA